MDQLRNLITRLIYWCSILKRKLAWLWYEHAVMRVWYAKDQGLYAVACDSEINERFGIHMEPLELKAWQMRCYFRGFRKGLFIRTLPGYFVDQWFSPATDFSGEVKCN